MKRDALPWLLAAAGALFLLGRGGGGGGVRCGVSGAPVARELRDELLDAWEARGYDRAEADRTIAAESGWRAGAMNCHAGRPVAGGVCQCTAGTLKTLGFPGDVPAFVAAGASVQVPWCIALVRRAPRGRVPGDTRLALFWPAAVGQSDDYLIADRDVRRSVWEQNEGLRAGWPGVRDGPITAGSVRATVRA